MGITIVCSKTNKGEEKMYCAKCGVKVTELMEFDLCSCCYAEEMENEEEQDMGIIYGEGL